ncbi:hypothetical protein [Kurthia zopfii]
MKSTTKKGSSIIIAGIVLVVMLVLAIGIGSVYISPIDTLKTIFGHGNDLTSTIVWDLRIP